MKMLWLALAFCSTCLYCEVSKTLSDPKNHIHDAGTSPDGQLQVVVTGSLLKGYSIEVYRLPHRPNAGPEAKFAGKVACFSPSSHLLAVWGQTGITHIYETETWQPLMMQEQKGEIFQPKFYGTEPVFSADDAVIAFLSSAGNWHRYSNGQSGAKTDYTLVGYSYFSKCFRNGDIACLSSYLDRTVIYDIQQGKIIESDLVGNLEKMSRNGLLILCKHRLPTYNYDPRSIETAEERQSNNEYYVYRTTDGSLVAVGTGRGDDVDLDKFSEEEVFGRLTVSIPAEAVVPVPGAPAAAQIPVLAVRSPSKRIDGEQPTAPGKRIVNWVIPPSAPPPTEQAPAMAPTEVTAVPDSPEETAALLPEILITAPGGSQETKRYEGHVYHRVKTNPGDDESI